MTSTRRASGAYPAPFELVVLGGSAGGAATARRVEARGELDVTNALEFEHDLGELAEAPLVLDLTPVSFMDSAAFAALDRVVTRARVAVVISQAGILRKVATIVGVPFHDDVQGALEELAASA